MEYEMVTSSIQARLAMEEWGYQASPKNPRCTFFPAYKMCRDKQGAEIEEVTNL